MNTNEVVLIVILKALGSSEQRALALEKYVQYYGALSQKAGERVKEILMEVENE